MKNQDYYLSLPHDMSGSMSKNRFPMELRWGISKILDLYDGKDFTMVFDYARDIEVCVKDGFEFYQIKTHFGNKSYTWKKLTNVKDEGSILGKLCFTFSNIASLSAGIISQVVIFNCIIEKCC